MGKSNKSVTVNPVRVQFYMEKLLKNPGKWIHIKELKQHSIFKKRELRDLYFAITNSLRIMGVPHFRDQAHEKTEYPLYKIKILESKNGK